MTRLGLLLALTGFALPAPAAPPDFDRQIAPLLASRCLDCHSGAKPKGGVDLSRKGDIDAAELLARVQAGEMPPKKPLPAAEADLLKAWVESGAKWGTDPIDPFRVTTATRAGYDWWSLRPVKRPAAPAGHLIDAFIRAALSRKGLAPAPPADRRTLIRRVSFDLTGLPPTPEDVEAFAADKAPDAYEKLVDKLLASPHYGERWARHWLDIVRYGETDGFERNDRRPNAWHYRDWLTRALNADLPYDEFARLQLAGDVLRPGDPEAVRATGFLVAGVHNTVLGNDRMRAAARQDELEDIVGAVGQTFLGLTVNCARCHDHKIDPIGQVEYYRLAAALAGVGFGERAVPDKVATAEAARLAAQQDAVSQELARLEAPARRAVLAAKGGSGSGRAGPTPIAAWDFRSDGRDLIGELPAEPVGGAKFTRDGATFDGRTGYLRTPPLPTTLRAKTLEAWVRLGPLDQRGGGVISVQTPDGAEFDAIVFGEREPGRWMAGSNFFLRSRPFGGGEETDAGREFVHVAVSYAADGAIAAYRNGRPYGHGYKAPGPVSYRAGGAVVLFGCRHAPAGGNKMLAGTVSAARLYDVALSSEQVAGSFAAGPAVVTDADLDARLEPPQRDRRRELRATRQKLGVDLERARQRAAGPTMYANVPQAPGVTKVLHRGDFEQPGVAVAAGGLAAVHGPAADFGLTPNAPDADRRRKLAEWVTHPANPLFPRVIVNRLWHYHFGTGLVETPSDLGFNGGRPSHPELLDWLAVELVTPTAHPTGRPWSLKHLHRLIVTSGAYRQSSAPRPDAAKVDADNRLVWRFRPRRLEGEAVRDAMLAVAGLLNRQVGGPGFSDYVERKLNGTAYFDPFDPAGPEFHRRSLYRFVPRGGNRGLLDTLDCPDPAAAAPRRAVTTTPLQALSLWNGGFALRMADAFAARVAGEATGAERQIARAWRLAYQRDPSAEEARLAAALVTQHGLPALCRALFNSNEFVTAD